MNSLRLYRCRDGVPIAFCIGEACLADFASAPIQIIALQTDPVAWLVFDWSPVTSVEDGWLRHAGEMTRSYLSLFGEGFVVRPKNDTRDEWFARHVLHFPSDGKSTPGGCK